MNHRNQVSMDEARLLVASCTELRNVLVAGGRLMPKANSKACRNTKYLIAVFLNQLWVPPKDFVKYAPCLFPPTKALLLEAIHLEITRYPNSHLYNTGIKDASYVDQGWLLTVLSSLN